MDRGGLKCPLTAPSELSSSTAGALVWCVLNKSLHITVQTRGGSTYGLSAKRSVIEGVKLDFDDAACVVERLNATVVQATARQRALVRAA